MTKLFQIGTYTFQMNYPEGLFIPAHFLQFEVPVPEADASSMKPDYYYRVHMVHTLPQPQETPFIERDDLSVYLTQYGESRLLGIHGQKSYYGFYQEVSEISAEIYIDIQYEHFLHLDTAFSSLFALERRITRASQLLLHCTYISHQNQAILFSGPSGIGKSTQAELWKTYAGSEILNGDRCLISQKDEIWIASGWPVCGSSSICANRTTKIKAIVMLSQGQANHISVLSPIQAFSGVYGQITVNRWNQTDVTLAVKQIEKLVTQIPVFHLQCNISEDAVKCLKEVLLF